MIRRCLRCYAPLNEGCKVCPNCGAPVDAAEEENACIFDEPTAEKVAVGEETPAEELSEDMVQEPAKEMPDGEAAETGEADNAGVDDTGDPGEENADACENDTDDEDEECDEGDEDARPGKKRGQLWLKIAIPALLLAAAAALFFTGILRFPTNEKPVEVPEGVITVPDVKGMSLEQALTTIEEQQLLAISAGTMESGSVPAGQVILQSPVGGSYASVNDTIALVISSGKGVEEVKNGISTVPYVIWDSREDAVTKLLQAGLGEPEIKRVYDEHVAFGQVVAQSDEAGKQVKTGKVITLKISIGAQTFQMPDVEKKPFTEAKMKLEGYGLSVHVEYRQDSSVPVNDIISQSVKAESAVRRGDDVTLVVSSAKEIVSPADVTGMSSKEAQKALEEQGFQVVVLENFDPSVAEDKVISQSPAGETGQTAGATVVIFVSMGKQPVKVTFDGNGGKATKHGKTVYFAENYGEMPTAAKKGETFLGWYTEAVGGSKVVNSTIVSNAGNHTLYAQFSKNAYKVTLDANGGSVSPASVTVPYNAYYGTLPVPHRTGYSFQGWYTDKTAGNLVTSNTVVTGISNHTLYARWALASCTVIFDANGGSPASSYSSVTYGSAYGVLPTVTRSGYHFAGWYTAAEGGTKITEKTKVNQDTTHTLYAHWAANTYQVTYDAAGGTLKTQKAEVIFGMPYGTMPTPARVGYNFQGWYTAASGGTRISETTTFNENGNQTLYAHWMAAGYTVTFSGNGGSVSADTKTVTYGGTYGELPSAGRTGYNFQGWYTDSSGGTQVKTDTKVTSTAAHTLYAHWSAKSYTLTYNANGGSVSPGKASVVYGAGYGALPTPTRSGYNFQGWYTAASGGTQVSASTKMTGNVTIYAQWKQKTVSGWVLASKVPSGAQIVDRKYTYDVTSYTTSSSPSLSGWTRYDAICNSWGAVQGPVYTDPSNGTRDVWSEQYELSRTTHYKYYHRYGKGYDTSTGKEGYIWGTDDSLSDGERHTLDLTYQLSVYQSDWAGLGVTAYKGTSCSHDGQAYVWFADGTYSDVEYGTRWYYQEPIYTYYYMKVESREATTEPSGSGISNIKEYVRYR